MLETLFIATQKFDPTDRPAWQAYIDWAKIPNLQELVSLDGMLCNHLITEFTSEDWDHIVNADFRLDYFLDLDYLLRRVATILRRNILGLYRNPTSHIQSPPALAPFTFLGYDLIEDATQISALTNCGGFPNSFSSHELNHLGLIPNFPRAVEIQQRLSQANPDEPHADCELYAIWRLNEA